MTDHLTGQAEPVDDPASAGRSPRAGPKPPARSPFDPAQAARGAMPEQLALPLPRWLGPLAVCCAIGIIPWIIYLALALPNRQRAVDYDVAWVGYDAALAVVMAALAYCALRRKPATGAIAAVLATMLVIDAWFDIITTDNRRQFLFAVTSAVLLEIPLAIVCAWVAVNAERVRNRAYLHLRMRWERVVQTASAQSGQARDPLSDPPGPLPPR